MEDHPWRRYSRARLQRNLVYPVGQAEIEGALTAAGARIVELSLTSGGGHWRGTLLIAWWHPRDLTMLPKGARLAVYAVPPAWRGTVAQLLRGGLLDAAAGWLSSIDPGSAWAGTERRWEARIVDRRAVVVES